MKIVANKSKPHTLGIRRHMPRLGGRAGSLTHRTMRKPRVRLSSRPRKPKPLRLRLLPEIRPVTLDLFAPGASLVYVAGSFNEWNAEANPLRKLREGRWSLRLRLKPGRYEYRFLVDGVWKLDPRARQYVTDFCGGLNSVMLVE
jgi:Glycogen recognition site of AMP-activated protein kinase